MVRDGDKTITSISIPRRFLLHLYLASYLVFTSFHFFFYSVRIVSQAFLLKRFSPVL
jgi:hypothetical protein